MKPRNIRYVSNILVHDIFKAYAYDRLVVRILVQYCKKKPKIAFSYHF